MDFEVELGTIHHRMLLVGVFIKERKAMNLANSVSHVVAALVDFLCFLALFHLFGYA